MMEDIAPVHIYCLLQKILFQILNAVLLVLENQERKENVGDTSDGIFMH